MSAALPGSVLRHRRSTIQEIVQSLDAFDKTADEIKEDKRTSGAVITIVCFVVISALVLSQLRTYFYGDPEFEYKFTVDTAFNEQPELELDMIVATPCTNLVAQLSGSTAEEMSVMSQLQKDPTRFEFTPKEQQYWDELKNLQGTSQSGGMVFKGIQQMEFVSGKVEAGLQAEAEVKQREEAIAIEAERQNTPQDSNPFGMGGGGAILLIGNGMNVFRIIASNSAKDEGTACRVHGRVLVNKVKGDSVVITGGKSMGIEGLIAHMEGSSKGNASHRIERLNFGPRIGGLLTPLAGTEQISETGADEYRYFLKVVPTRIYHSGLFGGSTMTYQYSVTKTHKRPNGKEHVHASIVFHYEFAALVIEVHQLHTSILELLVRMCSVVGGVFATSAILNSLFTKLLYCMGLQGCTKHKTNNNNDVNKEPISINTTSKQEHHNNYNYRILET